VVQALVICITEGKHVSAARCFQFLMRSSSITTGLVAVAAPVGVLGLAALLLWLSGNWRWVEGWIFGVWWVSFMTAMVLWLHYKDPALLAERMRKPGSGGESRSDMAILFAVKVCFLAALVLSALDVRFGWTPRLPLWSEVCGGILLLGGSFFMLRAFADNTYASQLIRIQSERGQHVIDTGVYGLVRHPMYLGGSLMFVGGPLLLGSVCGLLAGLAAVGFLMLRIFGEEKLLARDLEGYKEYLRKVRYRLVPHVW
jgi:protein-S-isoprenylcysteine O-methyltransferase Ste14